MNVITLFLCSGTTVSRCSRDPSVNFNCLKTLGTLTNNSRIQKWNESGFRPPLCTYRLNWARRTSWGWWDDWDDTVLQTQDSKFEPWRSEAEHATSRSRRLPTILTFTRGWGRNIFVSFKPPRPGTEPRTLAWKAAVLTTTLGPPPFPYTSGLPLKSWSAKFDGCADTYPVRSSAGCWSDERKKYVCRSSYGGRIGYETRCWFNAGPKSQTMVSSGPM